MTKLIDLINPKLKDLTELRQREMQLIYKQTKFHDQEMLSSCQEEGRRVRRGSMLD